MPEDIKQEHSESKWTFVTLIAAIGVAIAVTAGMHYLPELVGEKQAASGGTATPIRTASTGAGSGGAQVATAAAWEASAPGRVEPKGGKVKIRPETSGVIQAVYARVNDRVKAGDILVILGHEEIEAKLAAARAEVAVRVGERDEEPEKNLLLVERRKADDAVGAAERKLHDARVAFDRLFLARRAGNATDEQVEAARKAIDEAKQKIEAEKDARRKVLAKADVPKPTRLDSGLQIARSDLRVAEIAYEKTRVRAPVDGTILSVDATVGEGATSSSPIPLVSLGDMTELEVKAEVDERDVSKIAGGQGVVIRSNSFPGKEFTGKVAVIEPALASPALKARGPRKPSDVDVLEVKITLDGSTPLMPGMRVDVFFKPTQPLKSASSSK